MLNIQREKKQNTSPTTTKMPPHAQDAIHLTSLRDAESFWTSQADQLFWHTKPSRALQKSTRKLPNNGGGGGTIEHPTYSWFPGGEISTCYNCVDRHVIKKGKTGGDSSPVAIIWDSPVTGRVEKYTYRQLLAEVEALGGVLREEGVRRGDVVLVYSEFGRPFYFTLLTTILLPPMGWAGLARAGPTRFLTILMWEREEERKDEEEEEEEEGKKLMVRQCR